MLRRLLLPVVLLVATLCGGMWLGGHSDRLPTKVRDVFVDKDTRVVAEALGVLNRRYYRKVPQRDIENAALKAAVDSLGDQYSAYLPPKDFDSFNDTTNSQFDGIGVEVQKQKAGLLIARVYADSPAEKAGLEKGDVIVKAAGKSLAGLDTSAGSDLIRGPKGTTVQLGVLRKGKTLTKQVGRAEVHVPVVESHYDSADKVGVVRLATFSSGSHAEVEAGVAAMVKKGATGIVLDLRSNPGGLVDEAQGTASLFLKGGTVVTTRGRSVRTHTLKAGDDPKFPTIPLVVLVDRNSASAAEIVTGALQDRGRAKIVGTRTYGKGVFQEVIPLGSGGALDITVGQYYTPNGHNLGGAGVAKGRDVSRGVGIKPDDPATDDPKTKTDEAEKTAIDAVKR